MKIKMTAKPIKLIFLESKSTTLKYVLSYLFLSSLLWVRHNRYQICFSCLLSCRVLPDISYFVIHPILIANFANDSILWCINILSEKLFGLLILICYYATWKFLLLHCNMLFYVMLCYVIINKSCVVWSISEDFLFIQSYINLYASFGSHQITV